MTTPAKQRALEAMAWASMPFAEWAALCGGRRAYSVDGPAMLAASVERERHLQARLDELERTAAGGAASPQVAYSDANSAGASTAEPPLIGRWHHGEGYLVSGTIRVSCWDCDNNPPVSFRDRLLDWMCDVLNAAVDTHERNSPDEFAHEHLLGAER
jgi:hypothetical protein